MLLILGATIAATVYRFALPTDGWLAVEPTEFDTFGRIYQSNIMQAPSRLEPGDHLVAVEGISLGGGVTDLWSLRPRWRTGEALQYTVLRGEQQLQIEVPLVKWNIGRFLRSEALNTSILTASAGFVAFFLIALVCFWRRPGEPAARALWVLATTWLAVLILTGFLPAGIADQVDPITTVIGNVAITLTFTVLAPPAFIRFALTFPKPKPVLRRHPWIAYLPFAVGLVGLVAFAFQFFVFGYAWTALSILIAVVILIHNAFTMRDAVSKAQLRWGLGGMVVGLLFFFSMYITLFTGMTGPVADLFNALAPLGFGIMGVSLGIAVLRYRLFDIDVIIRRTLVYAGVTVLLALTFYGSILALQWAFRQVTGQESPVAIVASTLTIAALFSPLRRRVQVFVDRRFYRQKYNAQQVLAQFGVVARDETDVDRLTGQLTSTVEAVLKPDRVAIWLPQGDRK